MYIREKLKSFGYVHSVVVLTVMYVVGGVILESVSKGNKEAYSKYFTNASLVPPLLILAFSKDKFCRDIVYSLVIIVTMFVCAELFWDYMDKPWFSPPETYTCDGPCYGWFSFENDSPAMYIPFIGFFALVVGSVLRLIIVIVKFLARKFFIV